MSGAWIGEILEGCKCLVRVRRSGERGIVASLRFDAAEVEKLREMGYQEYDAGRGWRPLPEVLT